MMPNGSNNQFFSNDNIVKNGQIDISEFLFNNDQNEMIQMTESTEKNVKLQNQLSYLKRSPFRQEQIIQHSNKEYHKTSFSREFASISNFDIEEQKNAEENAEVSEINNDKIKKNKTYAKNYRQKKREKLNMLQEENRFLKCKIDDLSFRLKETELQLNKLKHNPQSNTRNFQTAREALLKQTEKIINKQQINMKRLLQMQDQLKKLNAFDSKHKMNLLNYFMSELLQNLINDIGFYFIDSLTQKKGHWKDNDDLTPLRRIDIETIQIMGIQHVQKTKQLVNALPQYAIDHMKNFKNLWKNLYQDYLNIINQGTLMETLCKSLSEHHNKQNCHTQVLNYLRLELHFEKIKYRKDMRNLRESWFRQFENQTQQAKQKRKAGAVKKRKLICCDIN